MFGFGVGGHPYFFPENRFSPRGIQATKPLGLLQDKRTLMPVKSRIRVCRGFKEGGWFC